MSVETQTKIVELTPEDIELISASKLADIRPVYSNTELLGDEVVALFWNGGMDGYIFEVIDLDNERIGNVDDEFVYDLENAYMVIFKKDFIKLKYPNLNDFQNKLNDFKNAYNALTSAWDELNGVEADLINETANYPFEKSFNDYKVNDWVETINTLRKEL